MNALPFAVEIVEAVGQLLPPLPVGGQRECPPHSGIVERRAGGVEPEKIGAEKIELVEVRPCDQDIQQLEGDQVLVPDNIGGARFVKV